MTSLMSMKSKLSLHVFNLNMHRILYALSVYRQWFRCSLVLLSLALYSVPHRVNAAIDDVTTFQGTVPFTCSFSGGSDVVEMEYTRNGTSGLMIGSSDVLSITSNRVPRILMTLDTIKAPLSINFRGVWLRSVQRNQNIAYKTLSGSNNSPISTNIYPSKFNQLGFTAGQAYETTLTVSANLKNYVPFEEYQFDVLLTCLEP